MSRGILVKPNLLHLILSAAALVPSDTVPASDRETFTNPTIPVVVPQQPAKDDKAADPRMVMLSVRLFEQHTTSENRPEGLLTKEETREFLKSCQNDGSTKLLSSPKLVLPLGQKGEFRSGSEMVYHIQPAVTNKQGEEITPESKKTAFIGTSMDATVTAPKPGFLSVQLTVEESALTSKKIEPGLPPAKLSRRVQTFVECPVGQSLALRGLIRKYQTTTVTRVPVIGDIPVLGGMFSKKRVGSEEVEFLVLITPEWVDEPPK